MPSSQGRLLLGKAQLVDLDHRRRAVHCSWGRGVRPTWRISAFSRQRQSRHGFTLVELLVVLSVIALLVSLLLPALSGARRKVREVHCLNNERQLFLAHMAYANENREFNCFTRRGPSEINVWPIQSLRRYLPQVGVWRASSAPADRKNSWSGDGRVFYCPEDPRDRERFPTNTSSSYFMHGRWGHCQPAPVVSLNVHRITLIKDASTRLFMNCKRPSVAVQSVGWAPFVLSDWHASPEATPGMFADGHARLWRYAEWPSPVQLPLSAGPVSGMGCP